MRQIFIRKPNSIYLNSFHPLCKNELGRKAVDLFKHPPFIDASCRREPDFENPFPTISALCRQGLFAPRLKHDDIIVYITIKRSYQPFQAPHNRLVAFLQVKKVFDNHIDGYKWFSENKLPLPSNCMVDSNLPFSFSHTAGLFENKKQLVQFLDLAEEKQKIVAERILQKWDSSYKVKSITWPVFIRTEKLYSELYDPVPLFQKDLERIFNGKSPNTRNPKNISFKQLQQLALITEIEFVILD